VKGAAGWNCFRKGDQSLTSTLEVAPKKKKEKENNKMQSTLSSFFTPKSSQEKDQEEKKRPREEPKHVKEEGEKKGRLSEIRSRVMDGIKKERRHNQETQQQKKGVSLEEKFSFISSENIRDAKGRRPDDPDYDARTLLVPQVQYLKMTDYERQYFDIKREVRFLFLEN
jgi:DNA mismatch repair protein MSH6